MSKQPVIINYQQVQDSSKVVPRASRLSSQTAGWQYIQLEHHVQPAYEMPEYCSLQHLIVLTQHQQLATVERRFEGAFREETTQDGSIAIVPANVAHQVRWNGNVEFMVLALEPSWIAQIAYESISPDCVEITPRFFQPDPLIHQIGLALLHVLETDCNSPLYVESAATLLAAHLLRHYSATRNQLRDLDQGLSPKQLQQIVEYIDADLEQNLGLTNLAALIGLSCHHFVRLFKHSMGVTPYQYIIQRRLERAKDLLLGSNLTIAQIAYGVGFANQSHLTYHFRRRYNITPKKMRET